MHSNPFSCRRNGPLAISAGMLAFATAITAAFDASAEAGDSSFGLGLVRATPAYKAYAHETLPFPYFSWEGEKFFFSGLEGGYRLIRGHGSSLSLIATPLALRFRTRDTSDTRLKQLNNRHMLGAAGFEWKLTTEWGSLGTKLQAELTGTKGYVADASYSYPIVMQRLIVMAEAGVKYESRDIVRHYYQVSHAEARRSGLSEYTPDAALSKYAGVAVVLPINARWSATAVFRRLLLDDSIRHSPMAGSRHLDTSLITVSRAF